jgi:hypothetical protein
MISKVSGPGQEISHYEISDRELPVGSTLGAPKATLIIKATGALEKVYSSEAGADIFGTFVLHHWDQRTGVRLLPQPGAFVIRPYAQDHVFELANGLAVHERVFMLSGRPQGEDLRDVDPPAAYYVVELHNRGGNDLDVATYASVRLHGGYRCDVSTAYDEELHAILARDRDGGIARIVACSQAPASYEVTHDIAKASADRFPGRLADETPQRTGDAIGIFHFEHRLRRGERARFSFTLTFALDGEKRARERFGRLPDAQRALIRTKEYYDDVLHRAIVMTPDAEVNRGVLWAKANMLRVELCAEQGWCFVNDPTRSNNSVARDTAWFSLGSDTITPHFSRDSLLWYVEHLKPNGMAVEFFDIRNGKTEDYGLSCNDDTPLLLISLWHHYCSTGDRAFLERAWKGALRAARFLLKARDDRGLVCCKAPGTGERGIAGWRNVIEGYRITGASTEVNSETYAAFGAIARIAKELQEEETAHEFDRAASELREAINRHLLDASRQLYYLTIEEDGRVRTEVTSDLVFPVLFGVADHDVATNIIATLSRPEFWSNAGLHTVPRDDVSYGPAHGYGLLGGIWGASTFWFARAAARYNPSFMAYALASSFRHYAEDPRRNNTVPGQFSEWLHGEALTNQGMMLSPWFPPKYLWAAVEGAGGLDLAATPPDLQPTLPGEWHWIAVRNVSVRGKNVSWFTVRADSLRSYATYPFPSVTQECRFDADASDDVEVSGDTAAYVALSSGDRFVIMVGNTLDRTVTTSVRVKDGRVPSSCRVRWYNDLIGEWKEERETSGRRFHDGLTIDVARHGYYLIEITPS